MAASGDFLALGIDGGGTGCRALLGDAEGRILGRGEGGAANIVSDPDGALASILAATDAALAGIAEPGRVVAVLGLAGANLPEAAARTAARLPFARARVVQDIDIAVAGALQGEDGIVAITGTGSVFARQRGGALRTIGGWGLVLGDEGSGAWIGRALCTRALHALDGFVPMTPLLRGLLDEAGGGAGLVEFALAAKPVDFGALAPRALAAAEAGDGAAEAVLAAAAADTFAAVDLLQSDPALPVVFLGGVAPAHAARAAGRWPQRPAHGSPLEGALWLARQEIGRMKAAGHGLQPAAADPSDAAPRSPARRSTGNGEGAMETDRFRDADLEAARAAAGIETHEAHVFPHPIWDSGDRVQLHVWEELSGSPDYFVEFAAPLDEAFRAGLGQHLARIAAESDETVREEAETALLVRFTGFWHMCDRIEEGFMRRMLVVTSWRYAAADGTERREGFPG